MRSKINKVTYQCELEKDGKQYDYTVTIKPIIPPTLNGWAFEAKIVDSGKDYLCHGKTIEEAFNKIVANIEK